MASNVCRLLLVSLLAGAIEASCDSGWLRHGASCYLFSHDKEEWGLAYDFCLSWGGGLVEVNDAFEGNFLDNQVAVTGRDYWIAGNDLLVEGEWMWGFDDKPLNATTFSNWSSGQPNNNGNENCLQVMSSGHWNDKVCKTELYYVCEKVSTDPSLIG